MIVVKWKVHKQMDFMSVLKCEETSKHELHYYYEIQLPMPYN